MVIVLFNLFIRFAYHFDSVRGVDHRNKLFLFLVSLKMPQMRNSSSKRQLRLPSKN
jgi:hypothetical protein